MSHTAIEDYAVIGNCHTAALISRQGSIDWWCPMRFDRPAVFAALLDAKKGGHFSIRPTQCDQVERRYVAHTNVLETTFRTPHGRLRLTDLMPLGVTDRPGVLQPHHAILRMVEGVAGEVEIELVYEPRFGYGRVTPRLYDRKHLGFWCTHKGEALTLYSDLPLELVSEESHVFGRAVLRQGERHFAGLSFARGEPLVLPPLGEEAAGLVARTVTWWQSWAARCAYEGPFREAVLRSALVLKLMTYAPSGAMVAAPTTSLPEAIGGSRNWDYRYCWLRDATLTMRALLELGYRDEARAFLGWLLHATHLTWPNLRVLYDLFGRTRIGEQDLDHLSGYEDSRPVRVGNHAVQQLQLDVYGEVIGAAHEFVMRGGRLAQWQLRQLRGLGETVCQHWREPDAGIWEVRCGPRHHVHSKVMCWRALDNLLTMHAHGHLKVPIDRFRSVRDTIGKAIETEGYSETVQSYVQSRSASMRSKRVSAVLWAYHRWTGSLMTRPEDEAA